MAIQGKAKAYNRTPITSPLTAKTSLWGKTYPCLGPSKHSLNIGLLGVSHLDVMTRRATIKVASTRAFQRSRGAAQILEGGGFPVLVNNPVALEHDTVLVLPIRITCLELGAFLNTDAKKLTKVNLLVLVFGMLSKLIPLPNLRFIPDTALPQPLPFLVLGSLSIL